MKVQRYVALALAALLALGTALEATAADPPATIWRFLGIPQGLHKIKDVTTNRRGNHPRLERKPPRRGIADPANLESKNPAIKKAAEIKMEEDLAPQKIKALKYLAKIGCGCYPGVKEALMAAMEDCTEKVRYEAAKQIGEAAQDLCEVCSKNCCCDEELTKKLAEIAYERDDKGCWLEASERVREAAAEALRICCPGQGPAVLQEEVIPDETIPTIRPDETIPFDPPPSPPGEETIDGRSASTGLSHNAASGGFTNTIEDDESLTVIQVLPAGSTGRGTPHASRSRHSDDAESAGGLTSWFKPRRRSATIDTDEQLASDRWLAEFSRPDHQPRPRSSTGVPGGSRHRGDVSPTAVAQRSPPRVAAPSASPTASSRWAPRDRAPDRGQTAGNRSGESGEKQTNPTRVRGSASTLARRATDAVPASRAPTATLTRRASEDTLTRRASEDTLTRRASEENKLSISLGPATSANPKPQRSAEGERPAPPTLTRSASDDTLTRSASEVTLTRSASEVTLTRRASEENKLSISLGPATSANPTPQRSAEGERPEAPPTLTRRASEENSVSISLGPATSAKAKRERRTTSAERGWTSSRIAVIEMPSAGAASRASSQAIELPQPVPAATIPSTLKIDISPALSPSETQEVVLPKVTRRATPKSAEPASNSAAPPSSNEVRISDAGPALSTTPSPAPKAAQVIWIDDE